MDEKIHVSSTKCRKSQKTASYNSFRIGLRRTVDVGSTDRGRSTRRTRAIATAIDVISGRTLSRVERAIRRGAHVAARTEPRGRGSVVSDRLVAMAEPFVQPRGFEVRGRRNRRGSALRAIDGQLELRERRTVLPTRLEEAAEAIARDRIVGIESDAPGERGFGARQIRSFELAKAFERQAIGVGARGVRRMAQPLRRALTNLRHSVCRDSFHGGSIGGHRGVAMAETIVRFAQRAGSPAANAPTGFGGLRVNDLAQLLDGVIGLTQRVELSGDAQPGADLGHRPTR